MKKREMKSALGASLEAEAATFRSRLAQAEQVLGGEEEGSSAPSESAEELGSKVVRDAFTMPSDEHARIEEVRARALGRAVAVSKSEVLRAGLLLLNEMDEDDLVTLLGRVQKVRTGRPKSRGGRMGAPPAASPR
jgi:hypothetical protein